MSFDLQLIKFLFQKKKPTLTDFLDYGYRGRVGSTRLGLGPRPVEAWFVVHYVGRGLATIKKLYFWPDTSTSIWSMGRTPFLFCQKLLIIKNNIKYGTSPHEARARATVSWTKYGNFNLGTARPTISLSPRDELVNRSDPTQVHVCMLCSPYIQSL